MAASRKLQGEIDRCLKKVSEGVELFEDTWNKVQSATNNNQKDKYESDLKKEIKKLQRMRDQIKGWIASGDIKDKTILIETRKLIETQMERFKVVERETKTKAYSKEGLGLAAKIDPVTRERDELNTWLITTIDSVQLQIDSMECDIESLLSSKKKKLDKEKQEKLDTLKKSMEKHKFHVGKLEVILRTLDNIANEEKLPLFLAQLKKIKDDVEYYLESANEPEYEENEYIYDDIDCLDEILGSGVGSTSISPIPTSSVPDTNPSTPTTSTGRMSPSLQTIAIEKQQQEYLRQHEIQMQMQQQQYDNQGHSERRKSYSGDGGTTPKLFKPVPVKAGGGGSYAGGGGKQHGRHNNVSPTRSPQNSSTEGTESGSSEPMDSNYSTTPAPPSSTNMVEGDGGDPVLIDNSVVSDLEFKRGKRSPQVTQEVKYVKPIPLIPKRSFTPTPMSTVPPTTPPLPLEVAHSSNGLTHQSQQHQRPGSFDKPETIPSGRSEREGSIDLSSIPSSSLNSNCNHVSSSLVVLTNAPAVTVMHPNAMRSDQPVVSERSCDVDPNMSHEQSQVLADKELEVIQYPSPTNLEEEAHVSNWDQQYHQDELVHPPVVNNAPQAPPPLTEQMIMDQYMSGGSGDATDNNLTTLKSMAQEVMQRAGINLCGKQHLGAGGEATTSSAHIPPLLGVAPLGPVPLHPKHDYQLSMLEAAHYHLPCPSDSEPLRQYLPRNPIPTPSYYPQTPLINSDTLEFFGRMSIETLFFIFYYLEGTRAQYMAAKVLKKQSWRFHTKFMMWFQRHEEPKVINELFEQGTYIYFDIEKWGQRKKDGFVFEYQFLEDRELN